MLKKHSNSSVNSTRRMLKKLDDEIQVLKSACKNWYSTQQMLNELKQQVSDIQNQHNEHCKASSSVAHRDRL